MNGLRIGVNALYLIPGGVGGTEIYLRCLLRALAGVDHANEYVVFTNRETGADLVPEAGQFRQAVLGVRAASRPARILYEQLRLPAAVRRERVDVLFNPGFTAPARSPCPSVTVFHDLQHKRHPEYFRWYDRLFWNLFLAQSARTSDALIAVSKATAADLEEFYPLASGKIHVVPHGVDEEFRRIRTERAPERFLLCVSTLHPHKNLERLIRCFAAFHREEPEPRLVLAGMHGFASRPVKKLIESLGLGDRIRLTGWIPREELHALYRRAESFVYPSTFEGFGMPVLEALAAGIPTCCSNIPPLRETANDAALLFDPGDDTAVLNALRRVTRDQKLRARLIEAGPKRAARFTWRAAAEATLAVLRGAVRTA